MADTLEQLQKQIANAEDLSSIVRTMKTLAATSVRQYERAAEALGDYYRTIELGLGVVLEKYEESAPRAARHKPQKALLVIFGSDHGLAGRFNEQILDYALEEYKESAYKIAAVGEQVINRVRAAGLSLEKTFHMPSSISAITSFVQQLLLNIDRWRFEEGLEKIILFFNRPVADSYKSGFETLVPVDFKKMCEARLKWSSRSLPTYSMEAEKLLSALLRQYFFVSLYRACALSLAAENASRLAAMQAAEKNIKERLEELKASFQHRRQAVITEELLDVISGFRAVRASKTNL